MPITYNPSRTSSIGRDFNETIKDVARANQAAIENSIYNCVILDVFSGEENQHDDPAAYYEKHVWWVLRTPSGNEYTVQCAHDYDTIQSQIGNVEAQKGRRATIFYNGHSRSDIEKGYCKIQADRDGYMPHTTAQSISYCIGALGGIFDEDALFSSQHVGYKSKNLGPKVG